MQNLKREKNSFEGFRKRNKAYRYMKEISRTRKDYIADLKTKILDELYELAKQKNYRELERYQYLEEKRTWCGFAYMLKRMDTPKRHRQYEELNKSLSGIETMTVEGNLMLRRASEDDFSALYEYEKKISGDRYSDEVLRFCAEDFYTNTASLYSLIYKEPENVMIGYCGINHFFREQIDIAIDILAEYRGKGYGTEALKCYVQMLRDNVPKDMKEIFVNIEVDNTVSQRLFEKIGAKFGSSSACVK